MSVVPPERRGVQSVTVPDGEARRQRLRTAVLLARVAGKHVPGLRACSRVCDMTRPSTAQMIRQPPSP
jgi:hypothetical protein